MPPTDSPLKDLFLVVIEDVAAWLLNQPVKTVKHEENIELRASSVRSDQIFKVALIDNKEVLLHLEHESSSTVEEMKWRMLDYMTRITRKFKQEVHSVVLYIGDKGKGDTGKHQIGNITWQYRAIRLQDIPAKELLNLGKVGLLPLIGLTKSEEPEKEHFAAIEQIKAKVSDRKFKKQLLTSLLELIPDKRLMNMIETHLQKDDLLLNTPYLQKIRGEGHEEGVQEVAKNLKQAGIDLQIIANATGLSIEEIKQL